MKRLLLAGIFLAGFIAPAISDPAEQQATKECTSYGLSPGTADFKDCVAKMADADRAASGAGTTSTPPPDAAKMRAQMNADAAKQRAQIDAQMKAQKAAMDKKMQEAQHPANGAPSKCVTTTNGTNTSVSCP